jgi:hypothetical protein
MQYPFSLLPAVLTAVEATMSPARFERYVTAAAGDRNLALRLYVWNARLCEEFYIPLQFTEVAIRNAISWRLSHLYTNHWFDEPNFINVIPERHKTELVGIVAEQKRKRGSAFAPDHVVACMSFGFWQNLMGRHLAHIFWRAGVRCSFPYMPAGTKRADVYQRMDDMRNFRNGVMHHYAIFDRRPAAEYQNLLALLSWICPESLWLVKQLSNPAAIIARRPTI